MRKIFLYIFTLLLILSSFTGCYIKNQKDAGIHEKTVQESQNKVSGTLKLKNKLVLWCYYEGKNRFQKIVNLCKEFNTSQSDIEVTPEYIPFADFNKQLLINYNSGRAPDLAIIDNPALSGFASQGMLADITAQISDRPTKELYFTAPWKSCIYNEKVYGLPLGSNCLALFYNIQMLESAGVKPPKNWSELEAAAKRLTKNGRYGMGIAAPKDEQGTYQLLPWLLSAGASIKDIDSPDGIRTFNFLANLIRDGSMSKEVLNWTPADVLEQFVNEKIAMMVNGSWQIPELKEEAPDLKYGVVPIPKDKKYASVLGGENIVAIKGKNLGDAVKVLLFFEKPDILRSFAIGFGYIPPRKDVASDSYWTNDPVLKVFMEGVKNSTPRGPDIKWQMISDTIITAFQEALYQSKSPETAAMDAQLKLDKLNSNR